MEVKLLKEGDTLLKKVAEPWDFTVDGDPNNFIRNMAKLMMESNGIGLAAPQVGVLKRVFVKLYACINPEIIESQGNVKDIEGCLSFPDLWLRVDRAEKIKVRYQNAQSETIETEFAGMVARVFQHELDHLNGVCFDTKVGPTTLDLAKEKRRRRSR
jgi:peptide deformylase